MKTIGEITREWETSPVEEWADLFQKYGQDERAGVKKLLEKYEKKMDAALREKERIREMMKYENQYPECEWICGIDEAGRGPLAGPVVAGAVILPKGLEIPYAVSYTHLDVYKRQVLASSIRICPLKHRQRK